MSSISSGPVVLSKFDSSASTLALAVVALDTHQVKVVSTSASQSAVNTAFDLEKGSRVSALSWISDQVASQLLAIGLTSGVIILYSPATNAIISKLTTEYNNEITDFHYSSQTNSGWAIDITGTVYEWNLLNFSLVQSFSVREMLETAEAVNKITLVQHENKPHLLVGSHSIYLVDIQAKQIIKSHPAHIQPISAILPIEHTDYFIACATGDRFINMYSLSKNTTQSVFVASSPVLDVSFAGEKDKSVLIARTENGTLEIFNQFLSPDAAVETTASKKRRRQLATPGSRSSKATIQLQRPVGQDETPLFIIEAFASNESIVYSWLESGSIPFFDSVRWIDESGAAVLDKDVVITKTRANISTNHLSFQGHDIAAKKHYNEGNAIVSEGLNMRDLEDEDDNDESLAEKLEKLNADIKPKSKKTKSNVLSNNTLTTILSQSLKNNDHSLLETVLSNRDPQVIKSTIERLDSGLAVILLDRLAERIARQASRIDQLNFWLKWIIIVHGGILSSLPGLSSKLTNLHSVLTKKSETLPRLIEIQTRMDILKTHNDFFGDQDDKVLNNVEDDSDVEYIEELDDAKLLNEDSDIELNGYDDYEDSGSNVSDVNPEDMDEDELRDGDEAEENGYSDEEIAMNNGDIVEDEK